MTRAERKNRQRGSSVLEFTLVGIPLIFVLVSTFEIFRGMWNYHALAYAIKEGTRYASVHGINCSTSPNTCTVTIAQITQRILIPARANAGVWPPSPGNAVGSNIQISGSYPFRSAISMFGHESGNKFRHCQLPRFIAEYGSVLVRGIALI